ncbi:hypothetical protein [Tritonibacter horizontis]|uniref:Uncharacterized protein n=1 Tax=Tritonibacter horizontis TaxID=1768241 RepID=A0A132BXC6_9RHOB|nr:hypothetical protein [Tritonibacter horizontis]KUP93049.1 hypothetical protein TRIHO_20870 [Tritonibacter horizontis]
MLEYTATADVKRGLTRAHEERAQVLRAIFGWMFARRRVSAPGIGVSRWA